MFGIPIQLVEFRQLFLEFLSQDQVELIDRILHYQESLGARWRLALDRRVYRQSLADDTILRLLILTKRL
jgi:regulator of sigma D